jgi:predicted ATPase
MIARGEVYDGILTLRAALPVLREQHRYISYSACSRALAEGLALHGEVEEATAIIQQIIAEAATGAGTFELPDLLRTQAVVLLASEPESQATAEAALKNAIELARKQSALGWELRSANLQSRFWTERGREVEARALLEGIIAKFTEGFDTADLREAFGYLGRSGR